MLLHTGGKGAYAAIDAVSGEMTMKVSMALRDGGTVYVYGALVTQYKLTRLTPCTSTRK